MANRLWLTRLSVFGIVLVLVVVTLGAWTRLRDAGLGCPDWPTCYGSLSVPMSEAAIKKAYALYPDQPLVAAKAWPEMIHRHFAKAIGLLCLLLMVLMWRARRHDPSLPVWHASFLFALVCLQGAFGAWTVTMKLFPPVVTGHLLLGFLTVSTLTLLSLRLSPLFKQGLDRSVLVLQPWIYFSILVLFIQIALGGWTASNYAATVCSGLPVCQEGWQQVLNFGDAFRPWGHAVASFEYAPHLGADAKLTIHITHRIGAMFTALVLLGLALALYWRSKTPRYRRLACAIGVVLGLQLALGVSNIVFKLPLAVAVAHNVVALILLQLLLSLAYCINRERQEI